MGRGGGRLTEKLQGPLVLFRFYHDTSKHFQAGDLPLINLGSSDYNGNATESLQSHNAHFPETRFGKAPR